MKSSFRGLELLALPFWRNGVTTTGEISLKPRWMAGSAKSSQMLWRSGLIRLRKRGEHGSHVSAPVLQGPGHSEPWSPSRIMKHKMWHLTHIGTYDDGLAVEMTSPTVIGHAILSIRSHPPAPLLHIIHYTRIKTLICHTSPYHIPTYLKWSYLSHLILFFLSFYEIRAIERKEECEEPIVHILLFI